MTKETPKLKVKKTLNDKSTYEDKLNIILNKEVNNITSEKVKIIKHLINKIINKYIKKKYVSKSFIKYIKESFKNKSKKKYGGGLPPLLYSSSFSYPQPQHQTPQPQYSNRYQTPPQIKLSNDEMKNINHQNYIYHLVGVQHALDTNDSFLHKYHYDGANLFNPNKLAHNDTIKKFHKDFQDLSSQKFLTLLNKPDIDPQIKKFYSKKFLEYQSDPTKPIVKIPDFYEKYISSSNQKTNTQKQTYNPPFNPDYYPKSNNTKKRKVKIPLQSNYHPPITPLRSPIYSRNTYPNAPHLQPINHNDLHHLPIGMYKLHDGSKVGVFGGKRKTIN